MNSPGSTCAHRRSPFSPLRKAIASSSLPVLAIAGVSLPFVGLSSPPATAAVPSCGASTVAGLELASGDQQVTKVGTAFSVSLQVQVVGTGGCPVPDEAVTFSAPTSGASATFAGGASTVAVASGASGAATAPQLIANEVVGSYQVQATVGSYSVTFSLTNTTVGAVTSIAAVSGNDQSAVVGTNFDSPLVVSVVDAYGDPVSGSSVTFSASGPKSGPAPTFAGGSAVATVQTGQEGTAVSPSLFAGTVSGTATVTASVSGASPVSFTLSVLAGTPYEIVLDQGSGQIALAGTDFSVPLAVSVTDQDGNPVAGANVTFHAPPAGASGIFAAGGPTVTVTTNSQGVAQAPAFSADARAGGYIVSASVPGVALPTTFAMVNEARDSASTTAAPGDYLVASRSGKVYSSGGAPDLGSLLSSSRSPIVALVAVPGYSGYWLVTANGHVHTFGAARTYGDPIVQTASPIVAMAATADAKGYWLVNASGRVFAFGDATLYGQPRAGPSVRFTAMAVTADGKGYWLVAANGSVFAYGDAVYRGSLAGSHLRTAVVGIAASSAGGYWLVTADGRVYGFGPGAPVYGRSKGIAPTPVVAITATPDRYGYWLLSADGTVTSFGDAGSQGTPTHKAKDLVAITS